DAVMFLSAGRDEAPAAEKAGGIGADDVKALEAEMKRLKAAGPVRETAISVVERPEVVDLKIHIRGSVHSLGEMAPRGVLGVATRGGPPAMPSDASGRRELADWLAGDGNPLTDRVIVNRVWHWLTGAGLVRTVDNFGTTG